jgi:hypothetical protein
VSALLHEVATLLPHALPAALLPPSTHLDSPVAHDVTPALQGVGFPVHGSPGLQVPQVPELQ